MSREFEKVAVSRGLPFAKIGMRVKFRDEYGFIYRHNGSANFDIFFDNGIIGNCHPAWKMTYFDEDGKVIENHGNEDTTYMFGYYLLVMRYGWKILLMRELLYGQRHWAVRRVDLFVIWMLLIGWNM